MDPNERDSPLSIASNIIGILTFVVAIAAAVYARVNYLRNSDEEYFRVKASLSWYKTESTWLAELIQAAALDGSASSKLSHAHAFADQNQRTRLPNYQRFLPEYQMYAYVMDDLDRLEKRLLEIVEETELRAAEGDARRAEGWTLVPNGWALGSGVAMAWLPVRKKALELVRQRDALTGRVQFAQMSMISSRVRDLETRMKWMETINYESLTRLEKYVTEQRDDVLRLEELVCLLSKRDDQKRYSLDVQSVIDIAAKARRLSLSQGSQRKGRGHERRPSTPHSLSRSLSR
ncbi:hypothetical protein SAPIO_CDS2075 [Scedosporium apiospermum]|uniref:Uncharacterized protein n=1 Tax=Pseudallescheria apiosperma TaxID=563466 RepID=A0A084GD69_PSEDA|nr:uncharacterized protein SAPIO_CDS2075 [Scedosporium apiospermum]KEZ45281.1 hypothetical protein SAPIO_CDS2075 [Scedosporium apiospermum]